MDEDIYDKVLDRFSDDDGNIDEEALDEELNLWFPPLDAPDCEGNIPTEEEQDAIDSEQWAIRYSVIVSEYGPKVDRSAGDKP